MNIIQYQQEVKRTCPDLGSTILNSIHMTLGMGSELMEELNAAMEAKDIVNISEELSDAQWYACNYATLHNIPLKESYAFKFDSEDDDINLLIQLNIVLGKLMDYDKKELAYGKQTDLAEKTSALEKVLNIIEFVAAGLGIDLNEGRAKVIAKLKLRYPEKFTTDAAINRDTAAERKVLES